MVGLFCFENRLGKFVGYIALISFWMLFEWIHLNWQLSWPWLTLGNSLASHPEWIQWYEFTGVGGGSLLILLTNILIYELILAIRAQEKLARILLKMIWILLLPMCLSFYNIFYYLQHTFDKTTSTNLVIVQPNIDPYQKFDQQNAAAQIRQLISLSEQQIDTSTRLVIWPETAMSVGDWQNNIRNNPYYQPIFEFANRHPNLNILSGVETYKSYGNSKSTPTARKADDGTYYDAFNAAILIKANQHLQFYNKSKLVPGVESLPDFLNFMGPVFEKFGGSTGGYGKSDSSAVLHHANDPYISAPIICYESIYGEYVSSYVARGANILAIITNDGWWGNTAGHKQHLQYARLRAIETRRWVARSANTGISAVIDEKGNILRTIGWNQAAAIKYQMPTSNEITFYVRFGDWIYKLFAMLAIVLIGWNIFIKYKEKNR